MGPKTATSFPTQRPQGGWVLSAGTLMGTGPPNTPRLDTWHRLCDVPPPSSVSPNFMVEQEPDGGRETPLPLLLCVCLLGALANQQSCIPACRPGAAQSPHNHSGLVVRPCRPAKHEPGLARVPVSSPGSSALQLGGTQLSTCSEQRAQGGDTSSAHKCRVPSCIICTASGQMGSS